MKYNHVVRVYPDGTSQHIIHSVLFDTFKVSSNDSIHDGSKVSIKEKENNSRARSKVYDYCRSNTFDWFITLTLDPQKVDSFDYDYCVAALAKFRKFLTVHDMQYVIVPEKHASGRYHFHGLVSGHLPVVDSGHTTFSGLTVYNIDSSVYDLGFTTASVIQDNMRVSTYVSKYITKDLVVPKGRKRYWASFGLRVPDENILSDICSMGDVQYLMCEADYCKVIKNEFGTHYILEFRPK